MASQFFGQYLLSRGLITATQLLEAVDFQDRHNLRIGDYAVRKGYIAAEDATRIHRQQATKDVQFGAAAVELGLLTSQQLDELLNAQRADHQYLGDVIVRLGFMTQTDVKAALDEHRKQQQEHELDTLYIPADVPIAQLAAEALDVTRKLMLRLWGLQTKYGATVPSATHVVLGDIGVEVAIIGDVRCRIMLGVPEAVATRAIRRLFGADPGGHDDLVDLASEFANVVAGNVASGLANLGKRVDLLPPKPLPREVELGGDRALVVGVVTPLGDACVAVTY